MTRATVCVMVLTAIFPSDGSAQDAPSRQSTVDALEAGQRVRVRAADALSIEGVFLGLEGPDILLNTTPANQAQRVPIDRLEALWVRERNTRKGAMIGAITGGVLLTGALLLYVNGYVYPEDTCRQQRQDCSYAGFVVAGGAIGAGLGAALGALTGFLVPGWSPVWP